MLQLAPQYQDNVVFVPFNEPEGNMFGTGEWSYDGISWLDDPTDYFAAWDEVYALIKGKMPSARIAGPEHQHPVRPGQGLPRAHRGRRHRARRHHLARAEPPGAGARAWPRYRGVGEGGVRGHADEGRELPININEYAFNYHTSVPGQMIQWISAIEESKVDADIAYWNIDGNLSDSAVQANRGNGQWWLFNAYGPMSGHTVKVTPPFPGENYTLQGVATLDARKAQARAIFGGAARQEPRDLRPRARRGVRPRVHATVREIPWTGQLGDSPQPDTSPS